MPADVRWDLIRRLKGSTTSLCNSDPLLSVVLNIIYMHFRHTIVNLRLMLSISLKDSFKFYIVSPSM